MQDYIPRDNGHNAIVVPYIAPHLLPYLAVTPGGLAGWGHD